MKKRIALIASTFVVIVVATIFIWANQHFVETDNELNLLNEMIDRNMTYAVIKTDVCSEESLEDIGLQSVAEVASLYTLVQKAEGYDNYYTVTQYKSSSVNQSMIYSITDYEGHLILIDGGWGSDVDLLRQIIDDNGGKVDAWILTHPHRDHMGAFNALYDQDTNLEIDNIYISPFDYDLYKKEATSGDEFNVYEKFLDITSQATNITELYAGDVIDICGLTVSVYNDYTRRIEDCDAANDGSLMFEVSADETSMLFCGDVGAIMSDSIISEFGDLIEADYIQMGHHGNGGLTEEFYRRVKPDVAFFDAPDWLMYPEDEKKYTTPDNIEIMESMGCKINSYSTAPNSVIIR